MKNKLNKKAVAEELSPQPPLNADKSGSSAEQVSQMQIPTKIYHEPARPYFSSPCLLSEMEDSDEFSDQFFF